MRGTLRDVLRLRKRPTVCVGNKTTIVDVVRRMNERSVGSALVVDDGQVVGIVTERDLLRRAYAPSPDGDARFDPVSTLMTSPVITRRPETTVEEALRTMTECGIRRLPVVDGERVVGMVSSGDLTAWVAHELDDELGDLTSYVAGPYAARRARDVSRKWDRPQVEQSDEGDDFVVWSDGVGG